MSGELNIVSKEMESMSKDTALDKFNSRWNCKINCKSIDGSVHFYAPEFVAI